jgi:hypothetical protein
MACGAPILLPRGDAERVRHESFPPRAVPALQGRVRSPLLPCSFRGSGPPGLLDRAFFRQRDDRHHGWTAAAAAAAWHHTDSQTGK